MAVISLKTLEKKCTKAQAMLVASLSKAKLDGMRAVSQVLSQAIPLERQAYSLDDDKGGAAPIKYVAPAYKKPPYSGLSEDQWG
jgi:hypothetical protein